MRDLIIPNFLHISLWFTLIQSANAWTIILFILFSKVIVILSAIVINRSMISHRCPYPFEEIGGDPEPLIIRQIDGDKTLLMTTWSVWLDLHIPECLS